MIYNDADGAASVHPHYSQKRISKYLLNTWVYHMGSNGSILENLDNFPVPEDWS